MRYFFYIKYLMPSANHAFLAGRCIACLHGFISGSKITSSGIGISFPSWATGTVGDSIAFVSKDFNALSYLSSARYFKNILLYFSITYLRYAKKGIFIVLYLSC